MKLQNYLIQLDELNKREEELTEKRKQIEDLLDDYSKERLSVLIQREKIRQLIRGW